MKSFNVIWFDTDTKKFEPYDVIPYLIDRYKDTRKKDRPTTVEEFKEFVKSNSMYQWWGRCEYEILLKDWPCEQKCEKWDIHQQVMMNVDIIANILIEEVKTLKT